MSGKNKRPARTVNYPEITIGPFNGGIGVAIWRNQIETAQGPRLVRSITIKPRRYRDAEGQWQDASSYRPGDLTTLILALEKAREFCLTQPLPGEQSEDDRLDGAIIPDEVEPPA